ncbi:hypothetical protein B0J17DRAFT_629137 [Rhizoctonia solani]|nr:hypothetical protein B0J17DRAFT_629137 [Rhizoctonia solani]
MWCDLAYYFEAGSDATQVLISSAKIELLNLTNYDQKYYQVKAQLRRVRNQCPQLVPIHILPFEILSRILCSINYCYMSKGAMDLCKSRNASTTPEPYLQVCSWWRRVAMESPQLWTHIDLIPSERCSIKVLERARVFAAQAGWAPLHIHVGGGWDEYDSKQTDYELVDFCAALSSRIQSLQLISSNATKTIKRLLESLLSSAVIPGAVTWLYISAGVIPSDPSFLVPSNRRQSTPWIFPSQAIVLSTVNQNQLEAFLRPIDRLWLDCMYPCWASEAYSGLVGLQLVGRRGSYVTITEHQLATILRAIPGLQFFHYVLEIQRERMSYTPNSVKLDDLEVVRLERLHPGS